MSKILNRSQKLCGELIKASNNQGGLVRVYELDENDNATNVKFSVGIESVSDLNGSATFAKGAKIIATALSGADSVLFNIGDETSAKFVQAGTQTTGTGLPIVKQPTPTAKTVSATLTAAELLAGIITVNQGAGASSAQQLPTVSDLESELFSLSLENNDSFDVVFINTSTVDAEDASVTTNTGWTLVGNMDFPAYSAAGSLNSSGILRLRRVSSTAWTAYRIA